MLRAVHQSGDRLVAGAQDAAIAQRPVQPATQHAAAHGGCRAIENARQSQLGLAREALVEFQIAAGWGGPDESRLALFGGDRQKVREGAVLRLPGTRGATPRRRNPPGVVRAAENRPTHSAPLLS